MAVTRERTSVPGIYRRGSRYEVLYRHRHQQKSRTFKTMTEARAFKARADAGLEKPTSRERFEDYAREWLTTYRGRTGKGIKARTLKGYERDTRLHTLPYFRGFKLAEIERRDVKRFYAKLDAEGRSPDGIRAIAAPLKAMFADAVEDGAVHVNPTLGVRIMGKPTEVQEAVRERALTRAELARFLAEVDPAWRFFFEFLTQTGLRISEAVGLTVGDVVFGDRPRIKLRRQLVLGEWGTLKTKAGKRDVPLAPGLSRVLWTRCAGKPADAPLFASERGSHLRDENVRNRVLNPARKAAGLMWEGFGFHTFRHTAASLMFESGKNVAQVSRFLGHEDPAFTLKTYIHLMDAGVGDVGFFDAEMAALVSTPVSTQQPETTRNDPPAVAGEMA
jgi:integrase